MGRMLGRAFLCAVAGLLGWILTEPFLPASPLTDAWQRAEMIMVLAVIGLIGLTAGFHQGKMKGGARNILLGSAMGLIFGLVGGYGGYLLGGVVATSLFTESWSTGGFSIIPRAIVFAILGVGLGTGIGLTQFRARIVIAGAFGGLVGGLICGLTFDAIGALTTPIQLITNPDAQEVGGPGRAIFWTFLGLTIGMFTAWLEQATRQAWVRLVLGRNEGKEWPIDGFQTHLGRDERAHVPLFGDNNVAPLHATITRQGSQYILSDAGSLIGTGYQGIQLANPVALQPGDTFQIGSHQLQFLVKASAARRIQEGRAQAVPVGYPGAHGHPNQPLQPIQTSNAPINGGYAAPVSIQPQVPQQPQIDFVVVALDGPLTGHRYLVQKSTDAGRESGEINLSFDSQASRRHATLSPVAGGIEVLDLGSTNGTYVDGQRITRTTAYAGQTIRIGSTTFRIETT